MMSDKQQRKLLRKHKTWCRLIACSVKELRARFNERSAALGCTMLPVVPDLGVVAGKLQGNVLYQSCDWGWAILRSLIASSSAVMEEMHAAPVDLQFVLDELLPVLSDVAGQEDPSGFAELDVGAAATHAVGRHQVSGAVTGKRKERPPAHTSITTASATAAGPSSRQPAPEPLPAAAVQPPAPEPFSEAAVQLRDDGWCVLPLFGPGETGAIRAAFWAALASFPEFLPAVRTGRMATDLQQHAVQGGFGALGNPASFHNGFVREWRARALVAVVKQRAFAAVMAEHPAGVAAVRLETIVDRMMVRRPSKRATAESWHRDEAVRCLDDDVVFGGWINFDPHPQILSAVPGSHRGVRGHGGFAKLSAAEAADARGRRQRLVCPPGHLLIFNEKLMHEVRRPKLPQPAPSRQRWPPLTAFTTSLPPPTCAVHHR
jgi:hypothetical protein